MRVGLRAFGGGDRRLRRLLLLIPLVLLLMALASSSVTASPRPPGLVHRAQAHASSRLDRPNLPALQTSWTQPLGLAPTGLSRLPRSYREGRGPQVAAHQVFGFVPYWLLGQVSSADLSRLTTVAYFALEVNGNGTFHERGPGWADYRSSELTTLVKQAHAAGDRVVLTVNATDQGTLDQLTHSPQAPYRLARAITEALIAKSLDGVNIDFEGVGSSDRAGLVTLVTELSQQLRAVDPNWQITMDTYGSSASDPAGFFDVPALAPAVDAFFVMAYDMGRPHAVTPTAPLTGPDPNDTQVVSSYLSTVAPSKILLGIPLYAYVFPTAGPLPGARVTGSSVAMTEDQIETEATQVYWDSATQVAWTAWRGGRQWYQTYFDDPDSVAAKVRLADQSGLAGVGAWTLGMTNSQAIRSALTLGGATKDWTPSPEPPIGEAYEVLAGLSPSSAGLSSSGVSSAFSDLSGLPGSDVNLGNEPDLSGGVPISQGAGDQGVPSSGGSATTSSAPAPSGTTSSTPGTSAPGTTAPSTSSTHRTPSAPTSSPHGTTPSPSTGAPTTTTTTGGASTTTTTSGESTTTTGGQHRPGGSLPAGSPPPAHLCQVLQVLEHLGTVLPGPGSSSDHGSAVAAAIAATAPGCAQSPATFPGPSTPICDLLAGVAQVATLGPAERAAADVLFESAGCGTTVPSASGAGQVAPSVQALACAVSLVAEQDRSPAFEQWGSWVSATAACSSSRPLGTVPRGLSPLVPQIVPQLAVALGDSPAEVCSIERSAGVTDPRCG